MVTRALLRRTMADLALLTAFGLFMGALGPYGTGPAPLPQRYAYWLACIVGGGAIGVALDETLGRRFPNFGLRLAFDSVLMTPAVALWVWIVGYAVFDASLRPHRYIGLLPEVLIVCVPVMALRLLVWRAPKVAPAPETAPEAGEAFRKRLSAKRREARLIAVEADDHYLRVHTDAGEELVTARFADALAELAGAKGFQTHRSWWVAADAIEAVRWRRGRGELTLACGLTVPVSRSNVAALKAAGWF